MKKIQFRLHEFRNSKKYLVEIRKWWGWSMLTEREGYRHGIDAYDIDENMEFDSITEAIEVLKKISHYSAEYIKLIQYPSIIHH